jgi:hypothetical protein
MNSVSWFLYLADVLGNLSTASIPFLIIGTIIAGACTLLGMFLQAGDYSWVKEADKQWFESRRVGCATAAKRLWPAILIVAVVVCFIPSKNTMYAIAASEVGEKVVKSEAVQGIATDATKGASAVDQEAGRARSQEMTDISQTSRLEQPSETLWVTDAELIRRMGVPEKIARNTLAELDRTIARQAFHRSRKFGVGAGIGLRLKLIWTAITVLK